MPNYNVEYQRPANMLLCLRDELNTVFPGRYTGTDGFVSGYGIYGTSAHNANDKGHCMAFDFSTTVGMMIDEPTGRALTDYLRTKKNGFFSYLIHDMGPVSSEPRIAGNRTGWKWVEYDGPQHDDHTHISLTEDYKWGDSCGLSQSIYDRTVYWGIKEWYESYKKGTPLTSTKPTPIPLKGALMALTDKEQTELLSKVRELHRDYIQGVPGRNSDGDSFSVLRSILAAVKGKPIDEAARKKKVTGK